MTHTTLHLTQQSAAGPRSFEITISDAVVLWGVVEHEREQVPAYGFMSWDSDIRPLDYSGMFGEEVDDA